MIYKKRTGYAGKVHIAMTNHSNIPSGGKQKATMDLGMTFSPNDIARLVKGSNEQSNESLFNQYHSLVCKIVLQPYTGRRFAQPSFDAVALVRVKSHRDVTSNQVD